MDFLIEFDDLFFMKPYCPHRVSTCLLEDLLLQQLGLGQVVARRAVLDRHAHRHRSFRIAEMADLGHNTSSHHAGRFVRAGLRVVTRRACRISAACGRAGVCGWRR